MPKFLLPSWSVASNIGAAVTTRLAGNLAAYIGDEKDREQALVNRSLLKNELDLPAEPCWLLQQHSNKTIEAKFGLTAIKEITADASFTSEKGVVCAVLTADCLPILLCDNSGTIVAAIHAGWRGLADNIIGTTIASMQVDPRELRVWFGPAISVDAYAVGEEVRREFLKNDAKMQRAFTLSAADNKWHANLYLLARIQLNELGVSNICGGEYCTFTDRDLFFSYRRERNSAGRMASLIWLK